jgi:ADP-heptose:LPS heptosyltransferase
MKQVLILNITRMGDLVQMGPLLARLQEEWPGVAVDLIVDRRFAPVASMLQGLRDIISVDFHELIDTSRAGATDMVSLYQNTVAWARPLLERKYDRIVNLTFNRPSALLAGYIGAPDMRGARSAWDGGVVIDNPWMTYFTEIHQYRRINRFNLVDVYAMGGSRPGTFAPLTLTLPARSVEWAREFLAAGEQQPKQWVAVQAGASDVMKAWRPQSFGQALARLGGGWPGGILFIGSPSEQETVAQVIRSYREAGGSLSFKNATGRTSLEQLASLLAECRLLLTNDTGPMHLAVAVKTPVLDLSVGHVDFEETGPYGPGHWVIQPELECAPCGFEQVCAHHACKDRLLPEQVADLMLHILGAGSFPHGISTFRVYESGLDEDQLGVFRLKAGLEQPGTTWYATFWRRYWYEAFTGKPSRVPASRIALPDAGAVAHLAVLFPLIESLCRRAEDIVRAALRKPVAATSLQALQREQTVERERMVRLGMQSFATAPMMTAFVRAIQNDNVQGLEQMARHHARAYRDCRTQLMTIRRILAQFSGQRSSRELPVLPRVTATYAGR